ncbi:MAG: formate dehydrogenase subunit delta [Proteobacteria bacterium]|nr:formate dehydrogenase subunit delta [Pseudomonadota bacterium]MBU6425806.1 formate dehydrogenase subunit delta [Rhodospirillales bacterium]MDE2240306.1 formate dehydrogenase subunit delta [Rhodospirillales bacterium]
MSHGTIDRLVYMANQISKAFAHDPEPKAVDEISNHLRKFWEKRMLAAIFAHLDAGGEGMDPLAKLAVAALQRNAQPA